MNWGGFAGGLAQGFNNGVNMGKTFDALSKQRKLDDIRAKGLEEAKGMQESAAADMVKEVGIQPAGDTITPDTRGGDPSRRVASVVADTSAGIAAQDGLQARKFTVGGQEFGTRDEAMSAARKKAPSVMDFMGKTLVPRMQEAYMAQGDVEKADAWGQWAEQRQSKKAMAEWAGAWRAASMGNIEKAADHVFNLYKTYDDGITPVSKEAVKDKDGNITGFNVKLKVDETGEERTQFIDQKALTEVGLAALSPPKMFEMQFQRQQAADKAAAEQRTEIAKEGRAEARDVAKETRGEARDVRKDARQQGYALEKLSIEKQLEAAKISNKVKQEVEAKVEFLRGAGYSEDFIRGELPGIIGVGDFKKRTAPEEARRLAFSDRMKSDPTFGRKSADEQQRIIEQDMKLISGGVDPKTAQNPAAGGLPAPGAKPRGVPVFDVKTGKIIYR
jgi:hypothetical protein